ncbi:hypothetical protein OSC00_22120 [Citrobacter freundii]|uniref:hypothetical protein n=1 Tax=Citrobacter freundii TaxID=546 RepID=UPI002874FCEE|nr:hypothetical protein [Citrobacter freundii]MDS0994565.1 hypothetical protein [Citrobacter freundii]
MSKIARYQGNVRAFASDAQGMERTVFGGTNQADDLTSQITASFLRGWGIVGASEHPSLEDFNAAMYAMSQFIAYQHQMGVPEWHAEQEYHIGSICTHNGESYQSLQNANIGSQPPSAKWTPVLTSKNGLANLHLEELPNFAKYGAPMIGELIEWPSDKMPNEIYPDMKMEFIPYIGQSFDPVKYPLLATLHPNLHLPVDMRANVVRGWDWGRGVDAGRVLMSEQNDAMQRITGELTDMCSGDSLQATGALTITAKPAQHWYAAATVSSAYLYYRAIGFDNASVVRTANENRMKNAAWNMIVRAK